MFILYYIDSDSYLCRRCIDPSWLAKGEGFCNQKFEDGMKHMNIDVRRFDTAAMAESVAATSPSPITGGIIMQDTTSSPLAHQVPRNDITPSPDSSGRITTYPFFTATTTITVPTPAASSSTVSTTTTPRPVAARCSSHPTVLNKLDHANSMVRRYRGLAREARKRAQVRPIQVSSLQMTSHLFLYFFCVRPTFLFANFEDLSK